jgi:hypothetical protein
MKKAVIKPTLKKENADVDSLRNYRPVSNLTAISKLLERVVLNQLNEHLSSNDLHCPVQSGYRPHHSCETLLVRMTNDINREIQGGNIVLVVLLDLSAAFDTIDHEILLKKLLTDYGISGKALSWMKSYLEDRSFCVKIEDTISSLLELLFGVPQGSLLASLGLFSLFCTSRLFRRLQQNMDLTFSSMQMIPSYTSHFIPAVQVTFQKSKTGLISV